MNDHTTLGDVIRSMSSEKQEAGQGPNVPPKVRECADAAAKALDADRDARENVKLTKAALAECRRELLEAMQEHGIETVPMFDRKPITMGVSRHKQNITLGGMNGLVGVEGFEWLTEDRVKQLWGAFGYTEKPKVEIPEPHAEPLE